MFGNNKFIKVTTRSFHRSYRDQISVEETQDMILNTDTICKIKQEVLRTRDKDHNSGDKINICYFLLSNKSELLVEGTLEDMMFLLNGNQTNFKD